MAAGGARRNSTSSMRSSINRPVSPVSQIESSPNIFDDEYAATDYADSIRAPSETNENPFQDPSEPSSIPSNLTERNELPHSSLSLQLRNSIRKSLGGRNATPPSDTNRPLHLSTNSLTMPRRSLSTASTSSYAAHSPSSGPGEPSHPYAMYPQGLSVSRTASLAAAQRTASLRSSRERSGPAHPYNLYPQDVLPMEHSATNNIPVGFPGHALQFHRRTGADGEEQDIIGPDGHTEQLPPYTRYPDESTTKTVERGAMPMVQESTASRDDLQEVHDPPRRPSEPENFQTEGQPEPPPPPTNDDQSPLTSMSEKPAERKRWSQKNWKEKSKTRICGVLPLWILLLILSMIVIIIIICASFVGSILDEAHKKTKTADAEMDPAHYSSITPSPTITYYDAAPTATPTYLTPLPTGTFVVPLGAPDVGYGECLGSDQINAWTCNLPAERTLCVELSVDQMATPDRAFLNTCNNHSLPGYGTQPPWLIQQTLKLVTDLDNEEFGPAWHFQTFYDKLVILPEWELPYGTSYVKRDWKSLFSWPYSASSRLVKEDSYPGEVKVGESAWFCHWDDTFIEGFIYATVSNPLPTTTTITSTAFETTATTTTNYWDSYSSPFAATYSYTTTPDFYIRQASHGPQPSSPSDGFGYAGSQLWNGPSQPDYANHQRRDDTHETPTPYTPKPLSTATSPSPTSAKAPLPTVSAKVPTTLKPNATLSSGSLLTTPTPVAIPQLVKFEERRLKGLHDTATCNLMQKMLDKTFRARNDTVTGQPITITLAEDDGPNLGVKKRFLKKREPLFKGATGGGAALEKRQSRYVPTQVDETCFCQWTSEQFETR